MWGGDACDPHKKKKNLFRFGRAAAAAPAAFLIPELPVQASMLDNPALKNEVQRRNLLQHLLTVG